MKKIKLSGVLNLIIKTYYSAEKDLSLRQCLLLALLYTTTTNLDSDVKNGTFDGNLKLCSR